MSWTKPGQGYTLQDSISEEKMGLPTMAIKPIMKDIEKLMKKHDAYVSNKDKDVTTISSPKPMKSGFTKDLEKLLKIKRVNLMNYQK
jgi:hypothetical protein|tara:strand:- start:1519 stop:1779 length:261 start_codon:yes stop_codon:yes gene_type:complete